MSDDDAPDLRAKIDKLFNDAMAQAASGDGAWEGLQAWLPDNAKRIGEEDPDCPPGMAYYGDESTWTFELDRTAPCDAFMREYPGMLEAHAAGAYQGRMAWDGQRVEGCAVTRSGDKCASLVLEYALRDLAQIHEAMIGRDDPVSVRWRNTLYMAMSNARTVADALREASE